MLSKDATDLLELDVEEFEAADFVADGPAQTIPPRTSTTCQLC